MKIVFFGTPEFASTILQHLLREGREVVAVITRPDKPKGRSGSLISTPVKLTAQMQTPPIAVYQPEKVSSVDFAETLKSFNADIFVVVAYGEILKQHVLDTPKLGCINIHASLLPKYRGAAPIQQSIIHGEQETGITIMHMVKKMDAGDMIYQSPVSITPNMTYGELEKKLCEEGCRSISHVLNLFEKDNVKSVPQNEELVTFAPKIELEDCEIDWNKSAQELHNLIRGVNPFPGAWCYCQIKNSSKKIKIYKTIVKDQQGSPGSILATNKDGMVIACGKQALLIQELQLEGKKRMSGYEFSLGNPELIFNKTIA